MSRRRTISCLDEHPNRDEINGVIARIPHIADSELPNLASNWINTPTVADARARALNPDTPLVLEVLSAFDAIASLWSDDVEGRTDLDPAMVALALKSVRDAVAAAYAQPVLGRSGYAALIRPWRQSYAVDQTREPDLGRRGDDVRSLLRSLPWLASRCHNPAAAMQWEALSIEAFCGNADGRRVAREEAWNAAILTGRRRTWSLLRRSGAQELLRPCRTCRDAAHDGDLARVLTMCLDGACGLLMADAISDDQLNALVSPINVLIPSQRSASYPDR